MDLTELRAIVESERRAALGSELGGTSGEEPQGDLPAQRARNLEFYLGDVSSEMTAPEGRSQVVSTDVADVVDGILPSLMDIFTGTDEVVAFEAIGPEDEEAAAQETDYVNYVFYSENEGFLVLQTMMKDALIQKVGVCKFWWEETEDNERETYQSLPDDAFALLMADESIELIEHTEIQAPDGSMLHDAVVMKRKEYGCVKVAAVPPEEFLIAQNALSVQDSRYCAHKTKRTRSELIEAGYPKSLVNDLPAGTTISTDEQSSRHTVGDDPEFAGRTADANRAMQQIEVWEHYIRVDWDGDGIAELRKVTQAGDKILDNEPFDRMPFAAITPILVPHRFTGRAAADLAIEIQKIKTAIQRTMLDSFYFNANPRAIIAEAGSSDTTLDDYLNNRPGSPIRAKTVDAVGFVATPTASRDAMPLLEYFDGVREVRTGVQRYTAGPDANTLNPFNSTATGANIVASAAQQRIRLIARQFAEGFKSMFVGIHALILKHGTDARQVKLRNKWVTVDPRQWKTRKDMNVMVGLGTGTRDQQQSYLMQMLNTQVKAIELQGGISGPLVTAENVYNVLKKLTENAGFNSVEPYFTEPGPEASQPKPPPPDPKMVEAQGKLQIENAKAQNDASIKERELQLEMQRMQAEFALKKAELEAEIALKERELQAEIALSHMKTDADMKIRAADQQSRAEERQKPAVNVKYDADNSISQMGETLNAEIGEVKQGLGMLAEALTGVARTISAPKRVIRGTDGKVAGIEMVN